MSLDFVDTNVLLYSISRDPAESTKREAAIDLLSRDNVALSVQVLQEFYVQATRASRAHPISHEDAAALVEDWTRFRVAEMSLDLLRLALVIKSRHSLSYWDAAIVAAASELGCRNLYTEDLQHGARIEGLLVVNPFK